MSDAYHWASFIAARVHVPDAVLAEAARAQPEWARFPADWHHLTLSYVGELPRGAAHELDRALCREFPQETLTLTQKCQLVTLFGRRISLVLSVTGAPLIEDWKARAVCVAQRMGITIAAQPDAWLPHVSLGYVKTTTSRPSEYTLVTSLELEPPRLYSTEYRLGVCHA